MFLFILTTMQTILSYFFEMHLGFGKHKLDDGCHIMPHVPTVHFPQTKRNLDFFFLLENNFDG